MTRFRSRPLDGRPTEAELGETRSRFLFARVQTSAHALTADYLRAREAGAESAATTRTA
jgi:hypothetical protein